MFLQQHFFSRALWSMVLFLSFLFPIQSWATHIVGGEISYRCLGNNRYEITLRVYRDCINGAVNAPFDDPASIGIFDRNGDLVRELRVPFTGRQLASNPLDACLVSNGNVCVETTTYVTTTTLPPITGGYRLVYQRCCRNRTVQNIVNPLETGATYDILLTEAAMARCNTSPRFRESWPPIYICGGLPFSFDHGATDADGDSLVYRLCAPFQGGTFSSPLPQPPMPPAYDEVIFRNPQYGFNNMLGGTIKPLQINSTNGTMEAFPEIVGQFVVGVCVEEYDRRTKVLLSSTRRDFQYNVVPCERTTAAFTAPASRCDTLQLTFTNQSVKADDFRWFFDYPRTNLTSTLRNPVFTFPDTGSYRVALIAEPGEACSDTTFTEVRLNRSNVQPDFSLEVLACGTGIVLQLGDASVGAVANIQSRQWVVQPTGGQALTSTETAPVFALPSGSSGTITYAVVLANGCRQTTTRAFNSNTVFDPLALIPDTIRACLGEQVFLNPRNRPNSRYTYQWSPATGLSSSTARNPILTVTGDAQYQVTVNYNNNPACTASKLVTVVVVPKPSAGFTGAIDCDGKTLRLTNTSRDAATYRWIVGSLVNPIFQSTAANPVFTFRDTGSFVVTLIATGQCADTLQQTFRMGLPPVAAAFSTSYRDCTLGGSTIRFADVSQTLRGSTITSRLWRLGDGRTSTAANPEFSFTAGTSTTVTLIVTTDQGCRDTITQTIVTAPFAGLQVPDTLLVCAGTRVRLNLTGDPNWIFAWSPSTGLDNPALPNPTFAPTATTRYRVNINLRDQPECRITDSLLAVVPPRQNLAVTGAGATCAPQATLEASGPAGSTFIWQNPAGDIIGTGPRLVVPVSGRTTYQLRAISTQNCVDSVSVPVQGGPVNVRIPELVAGCADEVVRINVSTLDANDTLTYRWTPLDAFASGTTTGNPVLAPIPGEREVFVDIANQFGCTFRDTVAVKIIDPQAQLSFVAEPQCDGASVRFRNTSVNAFGFQWDFGDPARPGFTSTEENPIYRYSSPGTYQVTLTIQYAVNCRKTTTQTVVIGNQRLVADFSAQYADCDGSGATIQFTDRSINTFNNAVNYRWQFTGLRGTPPVAFRDSSRQQQPTLTVDRSGPVVVRLELTNASNCTAVLQDTLDVRLATIALPDSLTLCPGESLVLNPGGDPTLEYEWTPSTGLDNPRAASPVARPSATTTYQVRVRGFGFDTCQAFDAVRVVVPTLPQVQASPDTATCGQPVRLTATLQGNARLRWLNNGVEVGTGVSIQVQPLRRETYVVEAITPSGCTSRDSVTVTNNGVNVVLVNPPTGLVELCEAQDVAVQLRNENPDDRLSYQWTPIANIVSGATTDRPVLRVTSGEVNFSGIVTNQFNCRDTVAVTVRVGTLAPNLQERVRVCPGVPTPLGPNADPRYTYQWSPATGLSASNVANPIFSGTQSTTYRVTVTDRQNGTLCEAIATVAVEITPAVAIQATPNDTSICEGATAILRANGAENYSWYLQPGFDRLLGQGPELRFQPAAGRSLVTVIGRNALGCADTLANLAVNVQPFNPGRLASPQTICANTPTALNTGGNPAYRYSWTPSTGLNLADPSAPIATLATNQVYQVAVTDPATGCSVEREIRVNVNTLGNFSAGADTAVCTGASVILRATTGTANAIVWQDLAGNTLGTGSRLSISPAEGNNFFVALGTDGVCTRRDTVNVRRNDFRPGDLATNQTLCAGVPTGLNPQGNPAYAYQWSPSTGLDLRNPANPIATLQAGQTYRVTVTDPATGCTQSETIVVAVQTPPAFRANTDTSLCQLGSFLLQADSLPNLRIRWLNTQGQVLGQSNPLEVELVLGRNTFVAEGLVGVCTLRDTVNIQVASFEPGQIEDFRPLCLGDSVALNPLGNQAYTYTWSPTAGLNLRVPQNPIARPTATTTYQVTVVDPASGCQLEKSILVAVDDPGAFRAGADTTLCTTDNFRLTIQGGTRLNVRWLDANGQEIGRGASLPVRPGLGNNRYIAIGENGVCTRRDTVEVRVLDFQPGELRERQETCVGVPVALNPNGNRAYQYTWSPVIGLNLSNPSNPIATLSQDQTYRVTVVDPTTGCRLEKQITVAVTLPGALEATPDTTICQPGSFILRANAANLSNIRWFDRNGNLLGTGNRLAVTPLDGVNQYIVVADQGACGNLRDTVNVRQQNFQPGDLPATLEVCSGEPVSLNPNGNPAYRYTWSPVTGLNLSNPANPVVTLTRSQAYRVTVVDPASGCSLEKSQQVNVKNLGNFVAGGDTTLCAPADVVLRAQSESALTVRWLDASGALVGTGNRITVRPVLGNNRFVAVANDGVCSVRDTVNVTLANFRPGDLQAPREVCVDVPTALNPGGNPNYIYVWSPTTGLDLTNFHNPIVRISSNRTYTVRVRDPESGCTADGSIQVLVQAPNRVVALPDTTLCVATPLVLRATTAQPANVTWYRDAGLTQVIGQGGRISVTPVDGRNIYYAAIRDTTNACFKAGIGGLTPTGPLAGIPADSAVVNVFDVARVAPPRELTVCANQPTSLNPNATDRYTYRWSPAEGLSRSDIGNPTVTTAVERTYSVTINSNDGQCSLVGTVRVQPAAPINPNAGNDTTVCSLSPLVLRGTGVGATRLEWSLNTRFDPLLGTGANLTYTPVRGQQKVYLRVSNASNCSAIDSLILNAPVVQGNLPATLTACVPDEEIPVEVTNLDPAQTLRYAWSPANLILSNPVTGPRAVVRAQDNASVAVQLTNQFGCTLTLRSTIVVADLANKVRFTVDRNTINLGESARVTVSGCTNCTFEWVPATGVSDPRSGNPVLTPTVNTAYRVKVNSGPCMAEFTVNIQVNTPCEEPYIFVPNSFTPNGDGQNDFFRVRATNITAIEFVVFNRWGQRMYQTTEVNHQGWDGTFQGKELAPDVYGYFVVVQCANGQFFRKQGNVTLFR